LEWQEGNSIELQRSKRKSERKEREREIKLKETE
jgi:hypothetical protein